MARLLTSWKHLSSASALLLGFAFFSADPARAQETDDHRPLSPAQLALFETAHLQNVRQPETLIYNFVRTGEAGFTDTIAVHVRAIRADGTKDLSFDFLSGAHHIIYPELDSFRGNPLVMLVLEHDVAEMKATLGLSAVYFRNRIRQSFVDEASLAETPVAFAGQTVPGRVITVQPFAHDARLSRLPSVQNKSYSFTLADNVPGGIAELKIEMPADLDKQLPAIAERISFVSATP